jgi:hypothetical protein
METAGNIPKMNKLGLADDQQMAINVGANWLASRHVWYTDSFA